MDKVLEKFEGLIRRSIAPSVTFFVIFLAGELIAAELAGGSASAALTRWIGGWSTAIGKSGGVFGTVAILTILGVSYGLSATQQILFDNRLKKNFDPSPKWPGASAVSEGRALQQLRDRVLERLCTEPDFNRFCRIEERTDYVLYEILGGIDPTDTRPFVDTAKAIGIVFSSAIVVTAWNVVVMIRNLVVHWPREWGLWQWLWLPGMVLIVIFYWLGREATAAQYRARALRLYVNFLMMPPRRLERRLLRPDEKAE